VKSINRDVQPINQPRRVPACQSSVQKATENFADFAGCGGCQKSRKNAQKHGEVAMRELFRFFLICSEVRRAGRVYTIEGVVNDIEAGESCVLRAAIGYIGHEEMAGKNLSLKTWWFADPQSDPIPLPGKKAQVVPLPCDAGAQLLDVPMQLCFPESGGYAVSLVDCDGVFGSSDSVISVYMFHVK